MADPIATKAPESDAQEAAAPSGAAAQPTLAVGEHCVTDRPTRTSSPDEVEPPSWGLRD